MSRMEQPWRKGTGSNLAMAAFLQRRTPVCPDKKVQREKKDNADVRMRRGVLPARIPSVTSLGRFFVSVKNVSSILFNRGETELRYRRD